MIASCWSELTVQGMEVSTMLALARTCAGVGDLEWAAALSGGAGSSDCRAVAGVLRSLVHGPSVWKVLVHLPGRC